MRGRFPRMERYIQALPDGLASYPRCTTKASIYRMLLDRLPEPMDVSGLPAEIAALIATPQPSGSWIETAKVNAVELAVADWVGSDAKFVALAEEMNNALLRSPMYRALVFVASPAFLIRTAARAWGQFHRGVPAEIEPDSADRTALTLRLSFPPRLYTKLIAEEKRVSYDIALRAAGARNVRVTVASFQETSAAFRARWD